MPAPTSPQEVGKVATHKSRNLVKKRRILSRRGRAQGDIGSDDEIERELVTDSDSEEESSSLDSSSDSDTEPVSEDIVSNGHPRAFTPSTSQSPGDPDAPEKEPESLLTTHVKPFFSPSGKWSEMVADETTNGPADLPVIEFADFGGQGATPTPQHRKAKKYIKNTRPVPQSTTLPPASHLPDQALGEIEPASPTPLHSSTPSFSGRPTGQTARQAYQQRLESDPSYVPTVGGFWGHDDRLLDKDLRSLSGWWRGRWQGRGRERGFVRGRGRGGFFGPPASQHDNGADSQHDDVISRDAQDVPPIERAWTHDGFEELKEKEEQRRGTQHPQSHNQTFRGVGGFRARGHGSAHGGRGGFARGGFATSSGRPFTAPGRVWFRMKPELTWTKQHEGFLYFELEPALKPRQGQGAGIQVKLPGKRAKIVRTPPRSHPTTQVSALKPTTLGVIGSDTGGKTYTIHLPTWSRRENNLDLATAQTETSTEDVFKVRPSLAQRNNIPILEKALSTNNPKTTIGPSRHSLPTSSSTISPQAEPTASIRSQLEQLSLDPEGSNPARQAKMEEAVLRNPSATEDRPSESSEPNQNPPLTLPSLQTVFSSPVPQASPIYGSPYGYAPALPPGIAMNQLGMPYELATGRPVYLQAPPPMYNPNPNPVMHSHISSSGIPFIVGHMHHQPHSAVSPDFLHSTSHTPPMNGFIDPSTGTPIFSFPRQTMRVEIRAPPESSEVKSPGKTSPHRPSGLRTTAAVFEPSRPSDTSGNTYFPTLATPEMGALPSYAPSDGAEGTAAVESHGDHHIDSGMLTYPQYPHQYYYPEPYYAPYMDMTQVAQYEMYPTDGLTPQGAVYY